MGTLLLLVLSCDHETANRLVQDTNRMKNRHQMLGLKQWPICSLDKLSDPTVYKVDETIDVDCIVMKFGAAMEDGLVDSFFVWLLDDTGNCVLKIKSPIT